MNQHQRFKNGPARHWLSQQAMAGGQAMMVATIFFLIISILLIFGMVGPMARQQKTATNLLLSKQSYFLAEAGIEDVVYRLSTGQTVGTSEVLSIGSSTVTTITTDTPEGKDVVSTGTVANLVRKVRSALLLGEGVAFHYGIQVGSGSFVLSNNAGVNGNVCANGSISGSNGSYITGSAPAVGTITGVSVGGTTQTGVVPQDFPIGEEQIDEWKAVAEEGGVVGSQTLSGTANVLGPKKIDGNLNLSNGARLTLTGNVWVTGTITLSNNAEIRLSSSYGALDGMVIVDGVSTISNGSTFNGSGTSGSYIMLLSTSNSTSAVTLSNNAGSVILYVPNGTAHLSNNAGVQQITAKTVYLDNNATLDYEAGLVDVSFSTGPGGGYQINSWQEVE